MTDWLGEKIGFIEENRLRQRFNSNWRYTRRPKPNALELFHDGSQKLCEHQSNACAHPHHFARALAHRRRESRASAYTICIQMLMRHTTSVFIRFAKWWKRFSLKKWYLELHWARSVEHEHRTYSISLEAPKDFVVCLFRSFSLCFFLYILHSDRFYWEIWFDFYAYIVRWLRRTSADRGSYDVLVLCRRQMHHRMHTRAPQMC